MCNTRARRPGIVVKKLDFLGGINHVKELTMKRKSLLMAVLLASSLAPALSAAQGVSLSGEFTDYTTWNLYGSTTVSNITPGNGFTYSTMYLTSGTGSEAGAGFAPNAIALDYNQAFAFDFHFHIPPSAQIRGDGLTFP